MIGQREEKRTRRQQMPKRRQPRSKGAAAGVRTKRGEEFFNSLRDKDLPELAAEPLKWRELAEDVIALIDKMMDHFEKDRGRPGTIAEFWEWWEKLSEDEKAPYLQTLH
jgi:hypothetical protein